MGGTPAAEGVLIAMARTRSTGTCALCGAVVTKGRAFAHLDPCAPAHDVPTGGTDTLLRLRIIALGAPEYWLNIEARAGGTLAALDKFLRDIWLECCGHLSMFSIPPARYSSSPAEPMGIFGRGTPERSMAARIGAAFARAGVKATYDYDFGSTTRLALEVVGAREGRIGKAVVRLLARNNPLPFACGLCNAPAVSICCSHESETSPFVCAAHEETHPCEDASFLPVVNSPRMGVCGYTG